LIARERLGRELPETQNRLLAALPPSISMALRAAGEPVDLSLRHVLHDQGEASSHVFFPNRGVISMLTVLEDGSAVEIATVGREGMVDIASYLGIGSSSARWLVQVPGDALRVEVGLIRRLANENESLRSLLNSYLFAMFVLVAQTAACNRRHSIQQRCARWLLMTHDRVDTPQFPMTHEFLADMLGGRRPSVSIAMSQLQRAGLIRYRRGRILVLDRLGLETIACECYGVVKREFASQFPARLGQ
jgi:CRP-like cAMP-binding protein